MQPATMPGSALRTGIGPDGRHALHRLAPPTLLALAPENGVVLEPPSPPLETLQIISQTPPLHVALAVGVTWSDWEGPAPLACPDSRVKVAPCLSKTQKLGSSSDIEGDLYVVQSHLKHRINKY